MDKFNPIFLKTFLNFNSFEKNLVCWAMTVDERTTKDIMENFIKKHFDEKESYEKYNEVFQQWNEYHNLENCENCSKGKIKITNVRINNNLVRHFKELDGTLLRDLVYRFVRTYDIYSR
jgi:ABC-type polar amino acid transport system ATPase subunit